MKTRFLFFLVGFCAAFCPAVRCGADLYVNEYIPARHDRFYQGEDRDFVGEEFDFSGVGHTSSYRWVTMISPTYFLTATHHLPEAGSAVTFYEGNVKADEFRHEYIVDDFQVTFEWGGVTSDLTLGRLVVPDNQREAILPEDNISYYPIVPAEEFSYVGADVFVYGKADIVGMNDVTSTYAWRDYWTASYDKYTYIAKYLYNTSLGKGPDEAYLNVGDSGAPTFVIYEDELALAGTHYFVSGWPPPTNGSSYFGDSFVPEYLDQITEVQIEGDLDGDQFVGSADLNLIRGKWNKEVTPGDLSQGDATGDGLVGSADLDLVRSYWGHAGPAHYFSGEYAPRAAAVPEPSGFLFLLSLLIGTSCVSFRRRRTG